MFDIYLTGEIVTEEGGPNFKAVWREIRIGAFPSANGSLQELCS